MTEIVNDISKLKIKKETTTSSNNSEKINNMHNNNNVNATTTKTTDDGVGGRKGSYYYAFGNKGSDANFQAPKKITKEEAIQKEKEMKAGVSKWNANNYHWEEKNLMPWVEQYLNEIYISKLLNCSLKKGSAKATKVTLEGGYAAVNVRKAKNIITYELNIIFHWEGKYEDTDVIGTIKWPTSFSQDQFIKEDEKKDDDDETTTTISNNDDVVEIDYTVNKKDAIISSEPKIKDENTSDKMDRMLRRSKIIEKQVKKIFTPLICENVLRTFFKEIMLQS